jgi:hypothetical protein
MKQIWPNYSYSPATNVLTLTGLNIDRDQLLLVTAADRGRIMYNFADSSVTASAFTSGANTSLTLVATTAGLTTTAALVIYYDDQLASNSVTISSLPAVFGTVTANTRSYGNAVDPMVYIPDLKIDVPDYGIGGFNGYYRYISNDRWGIAENDPIQSFITIVYITRSYELGAYIYRLWLKEPDEDPIACAQANASFQDFPTTGWTFINDSALFSGRLEFILQQRELYQVTLTNSITVGNSVTISSLPAISGTVTIGNSVTISSLPVQLSTTTIGGTARLNVTLSSATTIGATAPSYGNLYGGSDGTNLRAILVDSSGRTTVTGSVSLLGTSTVTFSAITGSVSILGTPSVTIGAIAGTVTANIVSTTVTVSALPSGSLTTRFGSVTTANTAAITTAVTNTSRKYLLAQNISTGTVTIGIGFSPTTTQGIQLTSGAGLTFDSFVPTGAVYWLGATTGAAYTILEG